MKRRHFVFTSFLIILFGVIGTWIFKIVRGDIPYVDKWTRALVDTFPDTYMYTFFRAITNLGSESFMYPFVAVITILLIIAFRDWLPGLTFGLGIFATHEINKLIKFLVSRDRPSILEEANAVGESFPSGHAMIPIVCYGLLAYFLSKKIKSTTVVLFVQILFALLVFLIGISRYVINVHYLTDIVAGFVFGFLCLVSLIYLYEWIQKLRTRS